MASADALITDIQNEVATYAANAASYGTLVAEFMDRLLAVSIADPEFDPGAYTAQIGEIGLSPPNVTPPSDFKAPNYPLGPNATGLLSLRATADTAFGALPSNLQSQLQSGVSAWMSSFNSQVQQAVDQFFIDNDLVTVAASNAFFAQQQQRIKREADANARQAVTNAAKRGFVSFQGQAEGQLYAAQLAHSDRLARAATDVAVEMFKLEFTYAQTLLQVKAGVHNATVGFVANLASLFANGWIQLRSSANDYARLGAEDVRAQVDAYTSAIQGEAEKYRTVLSSFQAQIERFKAESALAIERQRTVLANAQLRQAGSETAAKLSTQVLVERARVQESALEAGGTLATALMNSMSNIASATASSLGGIAIKSEVT